MVGWQMFAQTSMQQRLAVQGWLRVGFQLVLASVVILDRIGIAQYSSALSFLDSLCSHFGSLFP